jgi:O-antigen ligase
MNNLLLKYQSAAGQFNYALFLLVVALLPFPQIFLRYTCVAWICAWFLEGRWLSKPNWQDWRKMFPFLMFGGWYLWKIISGLWADNLHAYSWQLERYMAFGLLIPVGIWGVNKCYNWKHVCIVLASSCVLAVGVYVFTLFWVENANFVNQPLGTVRIQPLTSEFFANKISFIKHRLFLCSVEMMGIMSLLYLRKDILNKLGKIKGWILIILAIAIMITLILITGSRASIVSGTALLSVWALYKLPIRRVRYKIAFLFVACGLGLFALSQHPRMENFDYEQLLSIRDTNQKHNVRINIWGTALDTPQDYSLYGLGAGQSIPYLRKKYEDLGLLQYARITYASHNQYLAEWMELGIPGLIFFILAWISIPWCTQKRARKSAMMLFTLYALNMLTDCMWGMFDGIALWCVWMVLIRLQADTQTDQQTTRDAQ